MDGGINEFVDWMHKLKEKGCKGASIDFYYDNGSLFATVTNEKFKNKTFEVTELMDDIDFMKSIGVIDNSNFVDDSDIIDVSEITTSKVIETENEQGNYNWLKELKLPYKTEIMLVPQIEQEVFKMYNELCNYLDKLLKDQGKSLSQEIKRIKSIHVYYNDLLYILYNIAENYVVKFYNIKAGIPCYYEDYDNTRFYFILEDYLGKKLKNKIYEKVLKQEKFLSLPDIHTKSFLFSRVYGDYWWDTDGELEAKGYIDETNINILSATPSRRTRLWDFKEIKKEIIILYLSLWKIVLDSINSDDKKIKWKKRYISKIKNIIEGDSYYNYYLSSSDKIYNFLSSFIKFAESTVREVLPKVPCTQNINVQDDINLINLFLPKQVSNQIVEFAQSYKETISKEVLIKLIDELIKNNIVNPKVWAERLIVLDKEQWIESLLSYQTKSDYEKILKETLKISQNDDLIILVMYELGRINKLTPAIQKKLKNVIYEDNIPKLKSIIEKKQPLSEQLYKQLIELKAPIRKKISLDSTQIEEAKKELNQTIDVLSQYIDEEEINQTSKVEIIEETERNQNFSVEAINLLKTLLEKNHINIELIKKEAMSKGKLLNSYINDINKEFYEAIGDQLILVEEDSIRIDEYYIDMAKELLNSEKQNKS